MAYLSIKESPTVGGRADVYRDTANGNGLSAHIDNRDILGDRLTDHGNVSSAGDENRSITLAADGEGGPYLTISTRDL